MATLKSILLIALVSTSTVQLLAQSNDGSIAINTSISSGNSSAKSNIVVGLDEASLMTAHPKMMAGFKKNFPTASHTVWSKLEKGYHVSFLQDSKKIRAAINEAGQVNYSICELAIADLSRSVTEFIQVNYKGYTVLNAREVCDTETKSIFLVFENEKEFLSVKWSEGQSEEINKMKKAPKK